MGRDSARARAWVVVLAVVAGACERAPSETRPLTRETSPARVETVPLSTAAHEPDPHPVAERRRHEPVASIGGAAVVHGALATDQVRRVVEERFGDVERCYQHALSRRPRTQGRLSMHFAVSGRGHVESLADDYNSTSDAGLGVCVSAAIQSWAFPRSRDGTSTDVRFPFAFDSGY